MTFWVLLNLVMSVVKTPLTATLEISAIRTRIDGSGSRECPSAAVLAL